MAVCSQTVVSFVSINNIEKEDFAKGVVLL